MARKRPVVEIYAPAHFKATWEKFLEITRRDGQSASELIRIWVEGYVQRKDPGNPQRPITAWVPGHADTLVLLFRDALTKLEGIATRRGGELSRRMIVEEIRPFVKGAAMGRAADSIARDLIRRGFKVWE